MKSFKILAILFLVSACAPVKVNYDYEKSVQFADYKTFNFYTNMETGLSELDSKRFIDFMNAQLQQKGLQLSEVPDFFINIKSSEQYNSQRSSIGVGIGGSGRNLGGGVSIGVPVRNDNITRQIVVDFVDKEGIGLFWQAVTESKYNPKASPENREALLKQIVTKALEGFPPKQP